MHFGENSVSSLRERITGVRESFFEFSIPSFSN